MNEQPFREKYAAYYDVFNMGKNYAQECAFIELCIQKYSAIPVHSILDIACGTGLHSKNLSEKGYSMTGVDLSDEMIRKAKEQKIQNANFSVGNMCNFDLQKKFDCAVCMFASIGYVTENKNVAAIFKTARAHVKSGGLYVFDCWNGLAVMHEPPISRTKHVEADGLKINRTSFPTMNAAEHVCAIRFEAKVEKNNSVVDEFTENHLVRFFFPMELKKYLEDAGFDVLEICPTYELGKKVDEKAWNMAIICRAP